MNSAETATRPVEWIHLVDPSEDELRKALPAHIHRAALTRMAAPPDPSREPRPRIDSHGDHVLGVFIVAVDVDPPSATEITGETDGDETRATDGIYFQEIHVVVKPDRIVTVTKTPPGGVPFDMAPVRRVCTRTNSGAGMALFHLLDEVAERYLDLVDDINDEIDELEDNVTTWSSMRIRDNLSALRHDVLHIRRALAPTRDAARRVLDDRVELDGVELFPREVELQFADTYDKLLRAVDGLDLSRDLIAGVRDYHQAQVANDQNEVMKRLTAIASMLLLPTFIVGLYGQNLKGAPEFGWANGYLFSWGLIVVTTVLQVVYFRRKRWI